MARRDIFTVTDAQCVDNVSAVEKNESKHDWVAKSWTILINSLHDEIFMKIAHVEHGHITSLWGEIRATLHICSVEDAQSLRVELYGTSMAKCGNDLQMFISTIIQKRDKLTFLEIEVPQSDLVHMFVQSLHTVFATIQMYCAVSGNIPNSFHRAVEMARRYAAAPTLYTQLN